VDNQNHEAARRVTLDDLVRTGPGTLAGRYLRRFWQPVFVADKLQPGHAIPIRVMSEDLTLYRGEDGVPHIVAFRCPHRGTQLSTGRIEGDEIRCFYHGWKFNGSGQCTQQPAEDPSLASNVHILSYPAEQYLGLIFAFMGEGEPPPLPRYPDLEGEGVFEVNDVVVWPCNFFNRLENSPDEVHVAFVHADSAFGELGLDDVPEVWAEETEFGFTTFAKREAGTRVSHFHMPNSNYIKGSPNEKDSGWVDHFSWRVPVDDEVCASYTLGLTHLFGQAAQDYRERRKARMTKAAAGEIAADKLGPLVLAGKLRIEDIEDRSFIVNIQDYVAQVGQGAIANRHEERLGRSDRGVAVLRRIWLRELQALADGEQLKEWRRPDRLTVTSGV
jgi:5,5'-dehydrodivanillate O-demethylase